ncbi:MAG: MOSC domain-containing protein [Sphingobacteriales bacterium]|jgi:uncharacterized protein YcbX
MYSIVSLTIYPIKSLNGISVQEISLCSTGFELDRRWMLVDNKNKFLTQRTNAQLALFRLRMEGEHFSIGHPNHPKKPFNFSSIQYTSQSLQVSIWEDLCEAFVVSENANNWFSEILDQEVKLVYMPETTKRKVDPSFAIQETDFTSFSDAYPILMLSESSLEFLNNKLITPIGFDRFRANMVINGMTPHEEDHIKEFLINDQIFYGVKPCARCIMTTIDQQSGIPGKEPLKTLSSYREYRGKILFGQNVIGPKTGKLKIGDRLNVTKRSYS